MAAYYHTHNHENHSNTNRNNNTNEIHDHGNLHTLILMNPNLAHHQQQHGFDPNQPPPPQSQNILLLNSAAAAAATPFSPPQHQFVRLPPPDHNNITLYGYPQEESREVTRARQGLSLSLSSQNPIVVQHETSGGGGVGEGEVVGNGQVSVLGSKYLKPTQELLEEVVHVGDNNNHNHHPLLFKNNNNDDQSPKKGKSVDETAYNDKEKPGDGAATLSTAERQEIQMKKAKLVTMLDEAEQRYRQYHTQMLIVVETFERAAGIGSAKTYTALALKTISKQFRCLKDAIQGQIRAANKSLGEEEGASAGKIEGSRLKFIDNQIRQQRALQQLGMIQNHNAWRPQRGLPERSVSVLRAWLFEHFLHPYPKDSDKILLAKQTGLTRSQVSNWFINARVRLWKPMIEEMYNEELKDQEHNGSADNKASSKEFSNDDAGASISISEHDKNSYSDQIQVKISKDHQSNNNIANSCSSFMSIPEILPQSYKGNNNVNNLNNNNNNLHHQNQHGFTLTGSFEMERISQGSPKRQRSNNEVIDNEEILIKFGNDKQESNNNIGYPIISGGMNFIGGGELGSYQMSDIGRFETGDFPAAARFLQGNGISLSLGLPPSCENHHHHQQQQQQFDNLSATNHTFMAPTNQNIQFRRGNEFGSMSSPSSHSSAAAFECIDIQNRKGFAAQLLPDFVA